MTYKVVMNPASISVIGKDNYHVLRSSYPQDERAIVIADNLSKEDAEKMKKYYNDSVKDSIK